LLFKVYGDVGCLQTHISHNNNNILLNKSSNLIFVQPNALSSSGVISSQILNATSSSTTLLPQPIGTAANVLYSIQTGNSSNYENYDNLTASDLNASFHIDVESFVANLANLEVDPNDCNFQRPAVDANQMPIQHNQHLEKNQLQLSNDVYKLPSSALSNELSNVYNQTQPLENSSVSYLPQQNMSANLQPISDCLLPIYESNLEITKVDILNQVIQSSNTTPNADELEFEPTGFVQEDSSSVTFRNKLKIRVKGKSIESA